jgi:hypothetical protein
MVDPGGYPQAIAATIRPRAVPALHAQLPNFQSRYAADGEHDDLAN